MGRLCKEAVGGFFPACGFPKPSFKVKLQPGFPPQPGCSLPWCWARAVPIRRLGRAAHRVLLFRGSRGKHFNVLTSTSSSRVSKAEHGNES